MTSPVDLIKKLTDVFTKNPNSNIGKLFTIVAGPINDLETTFKTIEEWRDIDTAKGTTLDLIGGNVGQLRGAASDEIYRIMIKSKIARNLSKGDVNTIIRVIALAVGADYSEIKIQQKFSDPLDPEPAALSLMRLPLEKLNESGIELSQFVQIIQKTVAAGVSVQSIELAGSFEFGGLPEEVDPERGWGSVDDPNIGGKMGAVFEPGTSTDLPI
ncbi:hypothetical protein HFE03_03380 [Paenibacillus sp. EKM102P]|uniref:hypothetical protein n=1 Tax=unclassified Paenibacillus TaxID=185978 RepID=UPI00142E1524|nr:MULTISPECIES: hypothetical protein [unclassified Paenibacillus]KAF6618252.1 hypothetical protein HFE00_09220 [Paenibacillus sp. EKM101P]KAF6624597.1 hypothetical protein HFE03_03380 [Paenibacillus sp. EKM102P]KAF6635624.1 hypothetical protein HFE01_01650 [Paenibacillus sp. EKM10P]KAF6648666.1 hypothetical protein HFE02_09900 [Paenibacillus sp. EKM11P]